ncbi:MAG: hypothetical protein H0T86_04315 [Gemmatimonadales bacterium]|nr:hypothetical protein [Gemmatimonadales bacterium]
MPIPEDGREERTIRLARRVALVLAVLVLLLVIFARVEPEALSRLWAAAGQPVESGGLTASAQGDSPSDRAQASPSPERPGGTGSAPVQAASQIQDTASTSTPPAPRARRQEVITDVVLLPCATANPRPDGSFVIPPHEPTHRTIVGLPSGPGRKRQGFVVPPHDPGQENQVPIEVISMDSILGQSLQVPPHDPRATNFARPYRRPCMDDSTAR